MPSRCLPLLLLLVLLWPPPTFAQKWRFLVYGDTRGTNLSNQVNTNILQELARATTNEMPAFVLVPGDLVYSGNETAFREWTNAMAPVYQAGIPVYPVIGNHDDVDVNACTNVFGADIPDNGPATECDRTYSITYSNALVLALDTYVNTGRVNQSWIDAVLASNYMPHVFAFGHLPAFKVNHTDILDDYPSDRDTFWSSLTNAKARAYFCGHDHFYDHMRLDDGDSNPTNDAHQYIVGTGGAPLYGDGAYDGNNGPWNPQRLLHEAQYGYLVVEIDRLDVTITWKHRISDDTYVVTSDTTSNRVLPERPILEIRAQANNATLRVTRVTPSASNTVGRVDDLRTGAWTPVHQFIISSNIHEWIAPMDASNAFFRVLSE